jgi:AraC-like DNA-binding protein
MGTSRGLPTVMPQLPPGAQSAALAMLRLSTEGVPELERPALVHEFFESMGSDYDATPIGSDPIEIDITLREVPGIRIFSGKMQGVCYRRTRKSNDATEDLALVLNPRGTKRVAQCGREIVLDEGEGTLVSLSEPVEQANSQPGNLFALRVPMPQLAPRLAAGRDGILRPIPRDTPALGLLTDYIAISWQERTLADPGLQQLVTSHVYDLMAVAIGATRDAMETAQDGGVRAARLQAIKQDIGRHLDWSDLSVSVLAARHHCTERCVQRLFEREGTTFTEYVVAQRLAKVHRMLSDPRRDGDKISTIAFECGFGDVSYFNRAFRRSYGSAPSDIRARERQFVPGPHAGR